MRGLLELTMDDLITTQRLIGQIFQRASKYMVTLHAGMPIVKQDYTKETVNALKMLWRIFDDNNLLLNEAQVKDDDYFTEKFYTTCKRWYLGVVGVVREFVKDQGDEPIEEEPETPERKMRKMLVSHQRDRLRMLKQKITAINIDRVHNLSEMEACQTNLTRYWTIIETCHCEIWSHYRLYWPDVLYELDYVLYKNMYETTISLFNYKIDSYMYPSVRVIPHIGIPTWRMFDRLTDPHAFTVKSVAWGNFMGLSEVIRNNKIPEGEKRQLLIRTFLTYQVYEPLTPESSDNEGDGDEVAQQNEPSKPEEQENSVEREDSVEQEDPAEQEDSAEQEVSAEQEDSEGQEESVASSSEEDSEEEEEVALDEESVEAAEVAEVAEAAEEQHAAKQPIVPEEHPVQARALAINDDSAQMPPPTQVPRAAPRKRSGPIQISVVAQESAPAKRPACNGDQAAPIPGVPGVQRVQLLIPKNHPEAELLSNPASAQKSNIAAQMKKLSKLNMSQSKIMAIPVMMNAPAGIALPTAAPRELPPVVGAASMKMAVPMKIVTSTNTSVPMYMAVPMTMRMPLRMLVTTDVADAMESAALLTLVQPRQKASANQEIQQDLPMELVLQAPAEVPAATNQPSVQTAPKDQPKLHPNTLIFPSGFTISPGSEPFLPMEMTWQQGLLPPMMSPNIATPVTGNEGPMSPSAPYDEGDYDVD